MLIATIFIYESLSKLFDIRKRYPYSADPFHYQRDFGENNTHCFRCLPVNTSVIATLEYEIASQVNDSIHSEKQVFILVKFN
jgi:hypothetical protein